MNRLKIFLVFSCLLVVPVGSLISQEKQKRYSEKDFSVTSSVNYISSASIQLNPNSTDIIERNTFTELNGGYGYGFSIKKKLFSDDISIGFTTEYVKIVDDGLKQLLRDGSNSITVAAKETVWMIPVELSGYYSIPSFSESFHLYLGGGIGTYFGNRKREILNIETETISKKQVLNLHILSGIEYYIGRNFSSIFEVRFREGEYEVNSSFPTNTANVDGTSYTFQQNFNSKIFIDGLKLSLGLSYYFN